MRLCGDTASQSSSAGKGAEQRTVRGDAPLSVTGTALSRKHSRSLLSKETQQILTVLSKAAQQISFSALCVEGLLLCPERALLLQIFKRSAEASDSMADCKPLLILIKSVSYL